MLIGALLGCVGASFSGSSWSARWQRPSSGGLVMSLIAAFSPSLTLRSNQIVVGTAFNGFSPGGFTITAEPPAVKRAKVKAMLNLPVQAVRTGFSGSAVASFRFRLLCILLTVPQRGFKRGTNVNWLGGRAPGHRRRRNQRRHHQRHRAVLRHDVADWPRSFVMGQLSSFTEEGMVSGKRLHGPGGLRR